MVKLFEEDLKTKFDFRKWAAEAMNKEPKDVSDNDLLIYLNYIHEQLLEKNTTDYSPLRESVRELTKRISELGEGEDAV